MRELLALGLVLLVAANTVNSGAIYRRYRELELPAGGGGAADGAEALPADGYVAELRNDQIPVQVVEVVEPVLVAKPAENLRSVEPAIDVAEAEPAAVITNEIIPEKIEKLEEGGESVVRAIEQVVVEKQDLPLPAANPPLETVAVKEEQQLRNIEPQLPAAPIDMPREEIAEAQKKDELPAEISDLPIEKKLSAEALPEPLLTEALPEALPKEALADAALIEDMKIAAEPAKAAEPPLAPLLKAIKKDEQSAPEKAIPAEIEAAVPLKDAPAPVEALPELKALKEDEPLIEAAKKEEILEELKEERKEEPLEKKKEERREEKKEELAEIQAEKKEILKEVAEEAIKEAITEELKEKLDLERAEAPRAEEEIAPSGKQADTADATTARPAGGFIQQLVQNTPLGQLLNTFNGNNQAASEENTPGSTAATLIQAIQNTTTQITNSIQQGFQQQLQSLQSTFSGQPAQQQAAAAGEAPAASTARPQGPLQSIVTSFLGNGAQSQQSAAASTQQPAGPLQGILNLFGGNRAPAASAAAAPVASSTPAAEAQPANDEIESAPSEVAAPAADDASAGASAEIARDSIETADDSQEDAKPDDIIVNDDDSHE